jgi:hypothetical protein
MEGAVSAATPPTPAADEQEASQPPPGWRSLPSLLRSSPPAWTARLVIVPSDSLAGVDREACLSAGAGAPHTSENCPSRTYGESASRAAKSRRFAVALHGHEQSARRCCSSTDQAPTISRDGRSGRDAGAACGARRGSDSRRENARLETPSGSAEHDAAAVPRSVRWPCYCGQPRIVSWMTRSSSFRVAPEAAWTAMP